MCEIYFLCRILLVVRIIFKLILCSDSLFPVIFLDNKCNTLLLLVRFSFGVEEEILLIVIINHRFHFIEREYVFSLSLFLSVFVNESIAC